MNISLTKYLFPLILILFISSCSEKTADETPLKIWLDQPTEKWNEGLPVGNGSLGGMIYGLPGKEQITLNEETIWTGEKLYDRDKKDGHKYIGQIQQLLFDGEYVKAEKLAEEKLLTYRLPSGTMTYNEIGSTGIHVSRLGFGSHIRKEMVGFDHQREYVIREAYDLGINLFDVYDAELECYQYEPMGRFLKPVINDVVISTSMKTYEGRTMEEEFERSLRLFGREYIDLVRCHAFTPDHPRWKEHWTFAEKLFRYKEQGKIRAVGVPIHNLEDLGTVFDTYPIDYIIFPYNFYHNLVWLGSGGDDFESLPSRLRQKGVGVITMKPFMGDYLVKPFIDIARRYVKEP